MSIVIKTNAMKYKDNNGNYQGFNAIAQESTDQQIAAIVSAGQNQIGAIEQSGTDVLDSIPEDYSQMEEDVADLKSQLQAFEDSIIDTNIVYHADTITVKGSGQYVYQNINLTDFPKGENLTLLVNSVTGAISNAVWLRSYDGETRIANISGAVGYPVVLSAADIANADMVQIVLYPTNSGGLGENGATYTGINLYQGSAIQKKLQNDIEIEAVTNVETELSALTENVSDASAINNGAIAPEKTSFAIVSQGENLFDPETMLTVGKWFVAENGKAVAKSGTYTGGYGALLIPFNGTAFSIKQGTTVTNLYNWFYTDANMNIISSDTPSARIDAGYTVSNLSGEGKFICLSISNYTDASSYGIMVVSGTTPKDYQPYYRSIVIPGLKTNTKDILMTPSVLYAVVGDTLQIFYRGFIDAVYDDAYDVVIRCDIGQAYERFYQVTPVAGNIGDHTLEFAVYTPDHGTLVNSGVITLKVIAKMSSPASEKVVLYVGDSLAVNGEVPHEFKRRLTGVSGIPSGDGLSNITFIGSKSHNDTNYEGYGGWTFNHYNEQSQNAANMLITCANNGKTANDQHSIYKDSNNKEWKLETIETNQIKIIRVSSSGVLPSTGTLTWVSGGDNHDTITYTASEQAPGNPFWDSTEDKVDFGTYATRMGVSSIDYIYILLGWNGGKLIESTYKETVNTFITNVHTSFPDAKIILMGLEIPARDGLAANYAANDMYSLYYDMIDRVFTLNKWYAEIAENTENVYFLNVSGQFDSKYNMQTSTRQVNTRNATTEEYQSNGVHPAYSGYMQIADACYRHFNWLSAQ